MSSQRSDRPTHKDARAKGYRILSIQVTEQLKNKIDDAVRKRKGKKPDESIRNYVAKFVIGLINAGLDRLNEEEHATPEKASVYEAIQKLEVEVHTVNGEIKELRQQERALPIAFPSPEVIASKREIFLVVFGSKLAANGEPLSIDEIEASMGRCGINGKELEEIMNDLEDQGKIARESYGRFSLNE